MAGDDVLQNFSPISSQRLVYRKVTFTLPANSTLPVNIQFQQLKVISCTDDAAIFAAIGYSTDEVPMSVGLGYGVTQSELDLAKFYNALTLRNSSGAPVTLVVAFAFGNITDDRVSITGAVVVSGTVSSNTVSGANISNAQVAVTSAAPILISAASATKRTVIIKNFTTSAQTAYIGDAAVTTANGIELAAGESITIDTQAAVYGRTAAGTASIGVITQSN